MGDPIYRKAGQKNGWFYGWYYDPAGKRVIRSLKTADRRVARDRLRQIERQAHAAGGLSPNAPAHSVTECVRYIVEVGSSDKAEGTLNMYAKKGGHLARVLGTKLVSSLNVDDVQTYINQRLDEGAARESIRKELSTLKVSLEAARMRGLFRGDPRAVIPRFKVTYIPREQHLTATEFQKLLDQLEPHRRRWVMLAAFTGARRSELESLTWEEHLDLTKLWALLPGTKTAKSRRRVPIPETLVRALRTVEPKQGPVVEAWANIGRDLPAACARAGIPRICPNDLRRTYASWMKQAGEDSAVVARLLGHSSTRMVDLVYGRLNDGNLMHATALLPTVQCGEIGSTSVANAGRIPGMPGLPGIKSADFARGGKVPGTGIEPVTRGFSVPCSTN
jgi:integrase